MKNEFDTLLSQLATPELAEKFTLIAYVCSKAPLDLETHQTITDALIQVLAALPKKVEHAELPTNDETDILVP